MATFGILGATGMVGSQMLSVLLALPRSQVSSITTITRRPPPQAKTKSDSPKSPELIAHVEADTSKWSSFLASPSLAPPQVLISGLATTRNAAGGFAKQYVLEHDLNIALATAARSHPTTPTKTYVLISSTSASPTSPFSYSKMKGEIERDVLALDFDHTVILRPGLIGGRREESRPLEAVIRWIADALGSISGGKLKDFWTQDADVIARAAVRIGLRAQRGELPGKSTLLFGSEIMKLGKEPLTEEETLGADKPSHSS